ncbi:hypothetical protein RHSIM_Rhsim09G0044000 [Rhododendron simsii]|uniref:Uncharacterized protein n=1 Tax=Rhododendron simsii TaxID=118357 RepID=A0A834GGC6_RHOSS|nr:hypothetical protein RHSIM_Rhsim09G0044000 [Rhododendron simsii]
MIEDFFNRGVDVRQGVKEEIRLCEDLIGLRPSSSIRTTFESTTTHEYLSHLEMKLEAQNETIEKLLQANKQQQMVNVNMMEFLIEKGYTRHIGSVETSSND